MNENPSSRDAELLGRYIEAMQKGGMTEAEIAQALSPSYSREDFERLGYHDFAKDYFAKAENQYALIVTTGTYINSDGECCGFISLTDPDSEPQAEAFHEQAAQSQHGVIQEFCCKHTTLIIPQTVVDKIIDDYVKQRDGV